jgi:hypothetical protein
VVTPSEAKNLLFRPSRCVYPVPRKSPKERKPLFSGCASHEIQRCGANADTEISVVKSGAHFSACGIRVERCVSRVKLRVSPGKHGATQRNLVNAWNGAKKEGLVGRLDTISRLSRGRPRKGGIGYGCVARFEIATRVPI